MARILTSGFETGSLSTGVETDTVSNSSAMSVVTSPTHSGGSALQIVSTAGTTYVRDNLYSANTTNKFYARAWIYISVMPSGTTALITFNQSTAAVMGKIGIISAGRLQVFNASGTQIGSNSAALSLNTWYCVELSQDATGSNGVIEGRLNGVVFASGAGNSTTGAAQVTFGFITAAITGTIIFDDLAVNDSSGSNLTSYPGLGSMVRATPNAAGDSNTFGTQVGGTAGSANNYTRIDELTPDGTTSYNASITSASDLFRVGSVNIPAGSTINCVVVGGEVANLTGSDGTASLQFQAEKTTGGTISKSAAIIPNSTTMKVNPKQAGVVVYPLTLYTDPDGSPWTLATLASMQVGYLIDVAHTDAIAVSAVWALVDYTPPANSGGFFGFF